MDKKQRIFFVCPDDKKPTGGFKTIYRQVDILNNLGCEAYVVHRHERYSCRFFENETQVTTFRHIVLSDRDILVLPDIYWPAFRPDPPRTSRFAEFKRYPFGNPPIQEKEVRRLIAEAKRIVILNLNIYNSFRGESEDVPVFIPYDNPKVVATLVVSKDNERYFRYSFPGKSVFLFTKSIDSSQFSASERKKFQVCYMPRKRPGDIRQVLGILRSRGVLSDVSLVPIDGLPEKDVAAVMAESSVFLSFSEAEGLPRPPMEAMCSRCLVVGYHGQGGRELFDNNFSFTIESGDLVGFAEKVEEILGHLRENLDYYSEIQDSARTFIERNYSREQEFQDLSSFWKGLLGS